MIYMQPSEGPLLGKMIDKMKAKANGSMTPADRKLFVYSGVGYHQSSKIL